VTESNVPSLLEFARDTVSTAASVDALLFGESPLATQRTERRLYVGRMIFVIVISAAVWVVLSFVVGQAISLIGWALLAVIVMAARADVRRHRQLNFIPNGRIVGDDEGAFVYGLIGAVGGAVAGHVVGIAPENGAIGGAFGGAVFGFLDAISTRYRPTQKLLDAYKRPWKQKVERVGFAVIQSVALAAIIGGVGELLTPGNGMSWLVAGFFIMFRLHMGKGGLIAEYKADWADVLGAFLWGVILGVATSEYTLLNEPAEHRIVRIVFSILIPLGLGWLAALVAIDSGVPLGEGSAQTRLSRALALGVLSSVISVGMLIMGDLILSGAAVVLYGLSPFISFFVAARIARRVFGPNERGQSAEVREVVFGLTDRAASLWRGPTAGKVGGGFLRW
jgi:hypothetical protein